MNLVVQGLLLNYRVLGKSKAPAILFLHGWRSSSQTFDQLAQRLSSDYQVVLLDLPGFANSSPPPTNWHITDYAELLKAFLAKTGFDNVACIAGHSFGGRIAIKAVGTGLLKPHHLILMGSAGIGH